MITKRKKFNFYLGFFAVLFALSLISGCGGCSKHKKQESSVQKVLDDYNKGKLDYETALVYQVYSLYQDKKLPKKYCSKAMTREGDRIFREIMQNWNKFSEKTKKKLEPYTVNPLDPKSHYMQKSEHRVSFVKNAYASLPSVSGFNVYVTANNKVKIWYKNNQRKEAKWVLYAFNNDQIFEKETGLMTRTPASDNGHIGDDSKFDIFFKNMTDYGVTHGYYVGSTNKAYSYVEIRPGMNEKDTKATAVHEFFHTIQNNIDANEKPWWMEETATWCENFIYPTYDTEHIYLPDYFKNFKMRISLTKMGSNHEYGSYVWPLYLSQKFGNSIIKKIWLTAEPKNVGILKALEIAIPGGLKKAFKEFALWVYNKKPVKKFKDAGRNLPAIPSIKKNDMIAEGMTIFNNLKPLSLTIDRYFIKPSDKKTYRSAEFDFSSLRKKYPYMPIWAIVKVADQDPVKEDWSDVVKESFCFDFPDEDLEEVTLIFVNTDSKKEKTGANSVMANAFDYGCAAKLKLSWDTNAGGSGEYRYNYKNSNYMASMGGALTVEQHGKASVIFSEEKVKIGRSKYVKKLVPYGNFTYSYHDTSSASWAPLQQYKITRETKTSCNAADTWRGKEKTEKGYAKISFKIVGPDESEQEVSDSDLNAVPPEMRQKLKQSMAFLKDMERQAESMGISTGPKKGELEYNIKIEFGDLPAQSSDTLGGETQNEAQTFQPQPIELEGIFRQGQRFISINKNINNASGSAKLKGVLTLKP